MHVYLGPIGAVLGLIVSLYIYRQKKKKTKLICPRESNCDMVVHSTHATIFGIGNEKLGLLFYLLQGVLWTGIVLAPTKVHPWQVYIVVLLTFFGALFSIYLVALQALVIRAWCAWCLGSTLATALIVTALFGLPTEGFFGLLATQHIWWVIIHNLGFILGLGGATITDIFFFRFLKDDTISMEEKGTMDTLTNVIWVGLAILVVSGTMLFLPEQARLSASPKFLLKVIVVGVIIFNGILLNMKVGPRMRNFSFNDSVPARHFRCLAFALGAVSITSWYTAFLLGSFRKISLSFLGGLAVYAGLLACAIIGSQIFEAVVSRTRKGVIPPSL